MTTTTVTPGGLRWVPPHTLWPMSDEQRKPRPATQYGETAGQVAVNVQRLRKRRGMSIYELSADLRRLGRPITPAAVGKIERQQRQVTVDDLVALSIVLRVSPSALLLPLVDDPTARVPVTGAGMVPADRAWDWMDGQHALYAPLAADPVEPLMQYLLDSRPPVRRARMAEQIKEYVEKLSSRNVPNDRPERDS